MNTKIGSLVTAVALLLLVLFYRASGAGQATDSQQDSVLRIHLPREVTIAGDYPTLGQVGIIRGNESLAARAKQIALGRVSVPGQEVVFDRAILLSRLACNGISPSKVILTGAEKITIKQNHRIIKGDRFVEAALSFLKSNSPDNLVYQWNPVYKPEDLPLPEVSKKIKLAPRMIRSDSARQTRVQIAVLVEGKEIAVRQVSFRPKYICNRIVALVDLEADDRLSPENVRVESVLSDYPQPSDWKRPYGLVIKRRVGANCVIPQHVIEAAKPSILLKRNQTVVIKFEKPNLLVTAVGKALQEARAGEYIKVRNAHSNRIITAKVNNDGTVEPVF